MKGIKEFLNKKEMGLPIWAWALILAVVLVVFMKLRNKSGASSSQDAAATDAASSGVGAASGGTGDYSMPTSATDTSGESSSIDAALAALLDAQTTADRKSVV